MTINIGTGCLNLGGTVQCIFSTLQEMESVGTWQLLRWRRLYEKIWCSGNSWPPLISLRTDCSGDVYTQSKRHLSGFIPKRLIKQKQLLSFLFLSIQTRVENLVERFSGGVPRVHVGSDGSRGSQCSPPSDFLLWHLSYLTFGVDPSFFLHKFAGHLWWELYFYRWDWHIPKGQVHQRH